MAPAFYTRTSTAVIVLCLAPRTDGFNIFAPPRTRARALSYAVDAISSYEGIAGNITEMQTNPVTKLLGQPRTRANARKFALDAIRAYDGGPPQEKPAARASSIKMLMPLEAPLEAHAAASLLLSAVGDFNAPFWILPAAAVSCLSLPIMVLYSSGQLGSDRYKRELSGVTIKERALAPLLAALKRKGLITDNGCDTPADPPPEGCDTAGPSVLNDEGASTMPPPRVEGSKGWMQDDFRDKLRF